jgi:CheY-like chemotaxis protein
MVVDDYPYNIKAVQSMFARATIEVVGEQSGVLALQNIAERQTEH